MDDRLRIINLGLPKSGTTTLGVALTRAGMRVADWRIRKGQTEDRDILFGFVGDHLYRGYYETGDPLARLAEFDAVTEMSVASHGHSLWPQMDWGLLQAIRTHHPNTKFILSHRDPQALVKSMLGWSNLGSSRLPQQNVPGLPAGYGSSPDHLLRWIEGHYAFCRRVFRDDPDFLEYDLGDPEAPQKISAFLGIALPWWGRANAKTEVAEAATDPAPRRGARPRRVILHAGAPRTGSEALQRLLRAGAADLAGAGIAVACPGGEDEATLRLKLPEPRHDQTEVQRLTDRAAQEIDRLAGGQDRLILSEETIPGRVVHLYGGRFFPAAELRAEALARALDRTGSVVDHLIFALRPYDRYFAEVHRRRAAERPVPPFAALRARLAELDRGWPELVAVLQAALRPARVTVIAPSGDDTPDWAAVLPEIGAAGAGAEAAPESLPTDAALEAIQSRLAQERPPTREEIAALIAAGAGDTRSRGVADFPAAEARAWQDRYAAHLDRIAAMPDIALVRG
ncbi:sulfotransferase [Pseudodonghicola flavimaris]|uniref:sulfotransferase n=1 Tax=Pseudodonghicola flavimaris TaxID=3050036 RepID=UPI002AA2A9FC|nr:sulfotransferase [Pseudodonghicola flavimaris]